MIRYHRDCSSKRRQKGVSLIEVMIAVLITAIGLLGAAAMQVNALKYTDSAVYTSQASFIAYDILDRIRAHGGTSGYALANILTVPTENNTAQNTDLIDFIANVSGLPGGVASIVLDSANPNKVTVNIGWSEGKISASASGSFVVTTEIFSE